MNRPMLSGRSARARTLVDRLRAPSWAGVELLVLGVLVVGFIALSWWWLRADTRVPDYDNAKHLIFSLRTYEAFRDGHLLLPFRGYTNYPPLIHTIGALGMFLGGLGVRGPIMLENVIFVPLLAVGCYGAGTLVAGGNRRAGLLAAVFALGAPIVASQFHVMMLDAPQAGLVAASVWLLLASDRFGRPWIAAAAGVTGGLGMLTKQTTGFFLVGLFAVILLRGGWRNWRGLAAFLVAGAVVAGPWYLDHLDEVRGLAHGASSFATEDTATDITPSRFNLENLTWYAGAALNYQYLVPFCLLALGGAIAAVVSIVRRPLRDNLAPEMLVGAVVSWIGPTFFVSLNDVRYTLPAIVYVSVLATWWMVKVPRRWGIVAATALTLIAAVNFAGVTFGIGEPVTANLPGSAKTWHRVDVITLYSPSGYIVGGPWKGGDVLGLMLAAKADGKQFVVLPQGAGTPWFNPGGTGLFATIAAFPGGFAFDAQELLRRPNGVLLVNGGIDAKHPRPCSKIEDGTWVHGLELRPGGDLENLRPYCPPGFRAQRPAHAPS